MQWIADNLFVGNRLSTGQIRTSDGVRIDLRNITAPIIVFCSWGDNITPPQQALDWVLDLYDHEREIVENGQTIVYTMHQSIGHLGIFVSGKVATKEHGEFVSCMEMIDVMPPGLYEAVITEVDENTVHPDLVRANTCSGWSRARWTISARWEATTLRTTCASPRSHACRRSTTAYTRPSSRRLCAWRHRPGGRSVAGSASQPAALRHVLRPESFDAAGEGAGGVCPRGASARECRQSIAGDGAGGLLLDHHAAANYGELRDAMTEAVFLNTYGAPLLQALVGLGTPEVTPRQRERDLVREANTAQTGRSWSTASTSEAWKKP